MSWRVSQLCSVQIQSAPDLQAVLRRLELPRLGTPADQMGAKARLAETRTQLQQWAVALAAEMRSQATAREALQRDQEKALTSSFKTFAP